MYEKTSCKLCASDDYRIVLDVSDSSDTYLDYLNIEYKTCKRYYKECKKCNLVYRSVYLDEKEKEKLYSSFRDEGLRNETHKEYFERISKLPRELSENYEKYTFLKDFLKKEGLHMDVGGGLGVFSYGFIKFFKKWKSIVVEPTKGVEKIAHQNGIDFHNMYLNEKSVSILGNNYDLITVNHVLEHVDDPIGFLKMLSNFLNHDGLLYIEMPSTKDIDFLSKDHDRFMCQHEVIFNKCSVNLLASKANLNTIFNGDFISKRGRNNVRAILKRK